MTYHIDLDLLRCPTPTEIIMVKKAREELLRRSQPMQLFFSLACILVIMGLGFFNKPSYIYPLIVAVLLPLLLYCGYTERCSDHKTAMLLLGEYKVMQPAKIVISTSDILCCKATLCFGKNWIPIELDMEADEVLEKGCKQFLLVSALDENVLLHLCAGSVSVYAV